MRMERRSIVMTRAGLLVFVACSTASPRPAPPPQPTPAPRTGAPCFPMKPELRAADIYKELEKYSAAWYLGAEDSFPPPKAWGTCTVERGQIFDANGKLVAELSCGVRVVSPRIVDELGITIGARGKDVLARNAGPLQCVANGADQVRCMLPRRDGADVDANSYVVRGELGEDVLTGDAANAFFAEREIVEMLVSVWCH